MDQDLKDVIKETFYDEILPIILVASGIILTYKISESNLDTLTIFENFFYLPFVLALIVCRIFYKKYLHKYGSQGYVFVLLTIIFVVLLPLGNRIYIRKSYKLTDRAINGVDDHETMRMGGFLEGDGTYLKSYYLKVDMPALSPKSVVVLPVDKKTYRECKIKKCSASFNIHLGLLGAHYLTDVEVKVVN